jgi:hypothetical protein
LHGRRQTTNHSQGFLRAAGLTGGLALSGGAGVLGAVTDARSAAGAVPGGPILSGDRFPIGLFWPPPPFQTTLRRYEEIVEAGFTFSHSNNYLWGDSHIQRYVLSIADQVGLDVLVDDPTIRWLVHDFDIRDDDGEFTVTTAEARNHSSCRVAGQPAARATAVHARRVRRRGERERLCARRFTGAASDPTRWLLLSNYARRAAAKVQVTVGATVRNVDVYDPASRTWKAVSRDNVRVDLEPGAARLLRLQS